MDKITLWERFSGHGVWSLNHIERGWNTDVQPTPETDRQAEYWSDATWRKFYAYETKDGKVIKTI